MESAIYRWLLFLVLVVIATGLCGLCLELAMFRGTLKSGIQLLERHEATIKRIEDRIGGLIP